MSLARSSLMFCLLFATLVIGGCTQPLNHRPTLGGMHLSPTLAFGLTIDHAGTGRLVGGHLSDDRTQWRAIQFIVPFDGVVHAPTLRIEPPLRPDSAARFYGRYPGATEALDPQARTWGEELGFALSELGRSLIGTPFLIGYLGWHGELDKPSLSPRPYKRTEQNDWSSGSPVIVQTHGARTHD